VVIEQFEEKPKMTHIAAAILCERAGQKGIFGWKGRPDAQEDRKLRPGCRLKKMLGKRVFLELFVKVQGNWRESHEFVEELDWRRQVERLSGSSKL